NRKALESAQREVGEKFISVAEVAVGRRRADPRPARGLGKSETRRALFFDQFPSGAQQRFFQGSLGVAPRAAAPVFRPAHVNSFYMKRRASSREFYAGTSFTQNGCRSFGGPAKFSMPGPDRVCAISAILARSRVLHLTISANRSPRG